MELVGETEEEVAGRVAWAERLLLILPPKERMEVAPAVSGPTPVPARVQPHLGGMGMDMKRKCAHMDLFAWQRSVLNLPCCAVPVHRLCWRAVNFNLRLVVG